MTLAALFVWIAFAVGASRSVQECEKQEQRDNPSLKRTSVLGLHVVSGRCDWRFLSENDKPAMVIVTLALLGVAALQAALFVGQLRLMRYSLADATAAAKAAKVSADAAQIEAETARKAFVASNRPRLAIRHAYITDPGGDGGWLKPGDHSIHYTIVNVGQSAAKIVAVMATHRLIGTTERLPTIGVFGTPHRHSVTIEAGEIFRTFYDMSEDKQRTMWLRREDPFHADAYNFFFLGEVVYEDANKVRRRMGFCRIHSRRFKRFDIAPNEPDFEYDD